MHEHKRDHACLALFSGGLDSILAVNWMRRLGYRVVPVVFRAPYIPSERAEQTAADNGIPILVRDISSEHLAMMRNPVHGFGKNFNPCIDCHALMFRVAGSMLAETGTEFLISGEVLGQRPMSQNRGSLVKVQDLSGFGDLIVRPLSQKLLPDTLPIRAGWVDKDALLGLNGRTRNAQFDLAAEFGVTYPAPASGCLLTDRNYTLRLRELVDHGQADPANISLLRWGRHFRLSEEVKLIVGRDEADNAGLESVAFPGLQLELRDLDGPLGLLTTASPPPEILELAASILLHYSRKAPSPGYVKYGIDNNWDREILVEKCPEATLRGLIIALD